MNSIIKQSDEKNIEGSSNMEVEARPETDGAVVAKLAAIIEENRASIKKNWVELAWLDQKLLTLKTREKGIVARRSNHSKRRELVQA